MTSGKDPNSIATAEREHRILHGLACEWETALYVLDPAERRRMKPPLFSIRSMSSRWGFWAGSNNEICLSRQLVHNYAWDSVREVLLHEMAHQMSEQVFGAVAEKPHGPAFKAACRSLRANPQASGTQPLLQTRIQHDLDAPEDKIIRRVRKLLSLAQSQHRHEAEAAMFKAHELIEKYNLDLVKQNARRDFISVFVGKPALRQPRETYCLANLLLDFYFVRGLWVSAFVLEKDKMGRVLEISGTRENVRIAHYAYDFIDRFINREWSQYNSANKLAWRRKTDFAVGIIEGFRSRLIDGNKNTNARAASPSYAVIHLSDPELNRYFAYRYPHTASISKKALRRNETVFKDGIRIGRKMILAKGIVHHKNGRAKLLSDQ